MRVFKFIVVFALVFSQIAYSQDNREEEKRNYPAMELGFGQGKVLSTNSFVEGYNMARIPIDRVQSFSLKMLWQNPGYTSWQRIYKIPYYGFGLSVGNLFNPNEIGYPVSLYGVLGIPLKRWKKLEIYTELQFGIASNWKYYDPETNPMNIAIGSFFTTHVNFGFKAFYPLGNNLDLGAGIALSHFSNGGLERPNSGINTASPTINLKYVFVGRSPIPEPSRDTEFDFNKEIIVMGSYSRYQVISDTLDIYYYTAGGLSSYFLLQNTPAIKSGPGVDFNYLTGLTVDSKGAPGPLGWDNLSIGIGYQLEVVLDRLSLVGAIGTYAVHKQHKNFRQIYQRVGIKFYLLENIYAGLNVRSINFGRAEFMEINMGYRVWSAKRRK
jgi:hypothetical protein